MEPKLQRHLRYNIAHFWNRIRCSANTVDIPVRPMSSFLIAPYLYNQKSGKMAISVNSSKQKSGLFRNLKCFRLFSMHFLQFRQMP